MGPQVGGEGTRTPSPSFYRVSRPSPTTGRGGPILRSADGTLQACQRLSWRACSPHGPPRRQLLHGA